MKRNSIWMLAVALALLVCAGCKNASDDDSDEVVIENGVLKEVKTSKSSFVIPDGVTTIDEFAFKDCKNLTEVTIPDSVTTIRRYAFAYDAVYGLNLRYVTMGNGVKQIGERAFYRAALVEITIPDGVTRIENSTFSGCRSLTSVTIGKGVTSIGSGAFYECSNLKTVNYDGTQQEWEKINRYKFFDKYGDDLSGKTITSKDGTTWTAE